MVPKITLWCPFWAPQGITLENMCKWPRGPWNVKIKIFSRAPQWPPVYGWQNMSRDIEIHKTLAYHREEKEGTYSALTIKIHFHATMCIFLLSGFLTFSPPCSIRILNISKSFRTKIYIAKSAWRKSLKRNIRLNFDAFSCPSSR